jgi:hypothetical protein
VNNAQRSFHAFKQAVSRRWVRVRFERRYRGLTPTGHWQWCLRVYLGNGAGYLWGRTLFFAGECYSRRRVVANTCGPYLALGLGRFGYNANGYPYRRFQAGFTRNANLVPLVEH